jgi:hypothetical protein
MSPPHAIAHDSEALDERPIQGLNLRIIGSLIAMTAAGVAAWVHLEMKVSSVADLATGVSASTSSQIAAIQAASQKDHDLLTRMNGKLDALLDRQPARRAGGRDDASQ